MIFKKLTFGGIDSSEFKLYADDKMATLMAWESIKSQKYAETLSKLFEEKLTGAAMPVAEEMKDGEHYIILSAHSMDVTEYTVKIENGNVYITGGYLTIDNAYKAFLEEMLGVAEDCACEGRELDLTATDNKSGSIELRVPYNKAQLMKLFEDVNEMDNKVLTGTHTFGDKTNGFEITHTRLNMEKNTGKCCCILEIDLGRFSKYNPRHAGEDTLSEYDVSRLVSETYSFVNDGGIISVNVHPANPLMNAPDGSWFRGNIGGNKTALEMFTEGTELYGKLLETFDPTIRYLKGLRKYNIPFLFRPLHEINGDWFWWCYRQRDGGENLEQSTIIKFWHTLYDIINVKNDMQDLALWVYAPSPMFDNLHCYPGDDYVDIMGMDWYLGVNPKYPDVPHPYGWAHSRNKPMCLAETGAVENLRNQFDGMQLLAFIKDIIAHGQKICYFSTWTYNGSIAFMKMNKELMEDDMMMNLDDLAERWARESANK